MARWLLSEGFLQGAFDRIPPIWLFFKQMRYYISENVTMSTSI